MTGILYIVATPIGNLEDITKRALRVLNEVDFVIAEDTRRTVQLLTHYGIRKSLIAYFEHSKKNREAQILDQLHEGKNMALVTDAGTPAISDPGARLVASAHRHQIPVIPVPGPSAMAAALSVAGLPTDPFHFWGFLPPTPGKREKIYQQMATLKGSHCFYESPHKIVKRVEEWREHFSGFQFFVGREMTKKFETYLAGTFEEIAEKIRSEIPRGEYTIVLSREQL